MKNDIRDLVLVLESRLRLIVIESWDERRVLETLTGLAVSRGLVMHVWSTTEGLRHLAFGGEALDAGESCVAEVALKKVKHDPLGNLYVFCDLHPFLDEPRLVRLLKEIAMAQGPSAPTLVLVSHALKLPAEVQRYAARFSLTLPSEEELLGIVRDEATRWSERNRGARVRTDNRTLQQVVKNLRGLSHAEARSLAHSLICDDGAITQDDLPELNRKKFELLDMEGVLGFEYDTARFADVGGLIEFQAMAGRAAERLSCRQPVGYATRSDARRRAGRRQEHGCQGGGRAVGFAIATSGFCLPVQQVLRRDRA